MRLFGFELNRPEEELQQRLPSFAPPAADDGAVVLSSGFGAYGTYVDLDGTVRTEVELINKYRQMAEQPEIDMAIDDIVNESIIADVDDEIVTVNLDDVDLPTNIKKAVEAEFKLALQLLEFNSQAYEIYKRWYVDGRLYYHAIIDIKDPQAGIQELRYIDPRKIRKMREIKKRKDPRTGISLPEVTKEYYLFNEKGFYNALNSSVTSAASSPTNSTGGIKIAKDSIINTSSGITSSRGDMILSYLHKAIKPLNCLRSLEDSLIIYRISRAPERRIFYIDVGNLPKMKAEQYLRDVMAKFKNKVVYDSTTGEIRDDRKFMTMLEDFWLPRREGGRGTEITTLPGGQNLSQIDDIVYFQKWLYRSLNVPITRMDPESQFAYGNANEITRDEVKFSKFITRLRSKFAHLFTRILERQLVLKQVMTVEEFDQLIAPNVRYDFKQDNYFEELKEHTILAERVTLLQQIDLFVGKYFSTNYVKKKVLQQTDEEIEEMQEEMDEDIRMGRATLPAEQQIDPPGG